MEVSLVDKNFRGDESACHGRTPTYFKWDRSDKCNSKYRFITDQYLQVRVTDNKKNVAWLLEPREISPNVYKYIERSYDKFDYVITYDKTLLEIGSPKILKYVWGSSWIHGFVNEEAINNKTKNASMIASAKRKTEGHKLRHYLIDILELKTKIDVYGPEYKNFQWKHFRGKVEAYNDYRFSVAMENSQQPGYFSEKIIDCFAAKTIPIYWGDNTIGEYFNTDGILIFDTIDELNEIINSLSEDKYNSMLKAVEDNYNRCKEYIVPEDYIYNNYKFLLE